MANKHIAYYNLPLKIIQHWLHAHKLNSYLIELVLEIVIGYRVANRLLNPLAPEHMHQPNKLNIAPKDKCKSSKRDNKSGNPEWIEVIEDAKP